MHRGKKKYVEKKEAGRTSIPRDDKRIEHRPSEKEKKKMKESIKKIKD